MMKCIEILEECKKKNIRLSIKAGAIKVRDPQKQITKELLAEIRANKNELLALLKENQGKTIKDYPLAKLSQVDLDKLVAKYGAIEKIYPTTPTQSGLIYHGLVEEDKSIYVVQNGFDIKGKLDVSLFKVAWQELIKRHDILRTFFVGYDSQYVHQLVKESVVLPFEFLDWTSKDKKDKESSLTELKKKVINQGFEFDKLPLLKITLVKMKDMYFHFTLTHHHSILDGWCLPLLFEELNHIYDSLIDDTVPKLHKSVPFEKYIGWLETRDKNEAISYWHENLKCVSHATTLFQSKSKAISNSYKFGSTKYRLSKDLSDKLLQVTREGKVTMNVLMQFAWAFLLHKYSGDEAVVFGTTLSGRPAELDSSGKIIGPCINTIPIVSQHKSATSIGEMLREIQIENLKRDSVSYLGLLEIKRHSSIALDDPIFNYLYVFENYPIKSTTNNNDINTSKVNIIPSSGQEQTNYPLTLTVSHRGQVDFRFEYREKYFDSQHIQSISEHLEMFLARIASLGLDAYVDDISAQSEFENKLIMQWNQTQRSYRDDYFIHDYVNEYAQKTPQSVSLVSGNDYLTFSQLNIKINQFAQSLELKGVSRGEIVGLYLKRGIDLVVAIMAIHKVGGAYLPLDLSSPVNRVSDIIDDAKAMLVLCHNEVKGNLEDIISNLLVIDDPEESHDRSLLPKEWTAKSPPNPKDLAYVIYTSGSTGKPKGVMIEHCQLLNFRTAMQDKFSVESGSWLAVTTSSFDISILELICPLSYGYKVVVTDSTISHADTSSLAVTEQIKKHQITHLQCTPSLMSILLTEDGSAEFLSTLKVLLLGGEPMPNDLFELFKGKSGLQTFNMYGPTESTIWSSQKELSTSDDVLTVGKPIANTLMFIVDEKLNPLPIGAIGELLIGGDGLARGYQSDPKQTKEKFVCCSWLENERLYRTGDLARFTHDGEVIILGRVDDQIKVRGFRIEVGEIEYALSQLKGLFQSVVVARPDDQEQVVLTAYIVLDSFVDNQTDFSIKIKNDLSNSLPHYMIPTHIVILDAMPLTANGKINRRALPSPQEQLFDKSELVHPRNQIERQLFDIWSEALGHDNIGIKDSFFEIGGHSLSVTRVISSIRRIMNAEVTYKAFFGKPTIAALASLIESNNLVVKVPAIKRLTERGTAPLSFSQQRLWLIDQLDSSAQYTLPSVYRVSEALDLHAFQQALNKLVERHEVLRTNYLDDSGEPYQVVQEASDVPFLEIDLSSLREIEQRKELERLAEESALMSFDLVNDLMIRTALIKLAETEYVIHLVIHHIAYDGWSMDVLENEFTQLYYSFKNKVKPELPGLPIQYIDFAVWQRDWLQGNILQEELEFWRDKLSNIPQVHSLPLDFEREAKFDLVASEYGQVFDNSMTESIRAYCKAQDVTLYMFLQTAFAVLISRFSGENDVLMGSPISGRTNQDIEGLIGFFVNTIVLRSELDMQKSFEAQLQQNKNMILEAYEHQHLPFEILVDELKPQRDISHSPIFQILFSLAVQKSALDIEEKVVGRPLGIEFDIELVVAEGISGALSLSWSYRNDLFKDHTIKKLASGLKVLISTIISNASKSLYEIPILSSHEQDEIIKLSTGQCKCFDMPSNVHSMIEHWAQVSPETIALSQETHSMSYSQLNGYSNQLARILVEEGVQSGDYIGIYIEKSIEAIAGIIAVLKLGAAYVPLDPAYPQSRLAHMVEDAEIKCVIANGNHFSSDNNFALKVVSLNENELRSKLYEQSQEDMSIDVKNIDSAYVIYTSGSTGLPKGVTVSHGSLLEFIHSSIDRYHLNCDDAMLQFCSLGFDTSVEEVFTTLCTGGKLVIANDDWREVGNLFWQRCASEQITRLSIPTAFWHLLAQETESVPSSVRQIIVGGEQVNTKAVKTWIRAIGDIPSLINSYGPTEATIATCEHLVSDQAYIKVPIGRPLANTQCFVLGKHRDLLPLGAIGELYIGGMGLAKEYLNHPKLTLERFIENPFGEGRLYRTGDLVRWRTDGELEYIGRNDSQVKVRGFRIELGEIEQALQDIPGIESAAVLVHESDTGTTLLGYVETKLGEIRETCQSVLSTKLPDYMIPSVYIMLPTFPLSPNGKIDRLKLPLPSELDLRTQTYVAPSTSTEQILCELWSSLLSIEQVGVTDNFFHIGGHSLLATRLTARIRNEFDLSEQQVSLRHVFECPTISKMSRLIANYKTIEKIVGKQSELDTLDEIEEGIL